MACAVRALLPCRVRARGRACVRIHSQSNHPSAHPPRPSAVPRARDPPVASLNSDLDLGPFELALEPFARLEEIEGLE
jgi:hypothetical protein